MAGGADLGEKVLVEGMPQLCNIHSGRELLSQGSAMRSKANSKKWPSTCTDMILRRSRSIPAKLTSHDLG